MKEEWLLNGIPPEEMLVDDVDPKSRPEYQADDQIGEDGLASNFEARSGGRAIVPLGTNIPVQGPDRRIFMAFPRKPPELGS